MTDVSKRYISSWSFYLGEQKHFSKNIYQINPVHYGVFPGRLISEGKQWTIVHEQWAIVFQKFLYGDKVVMEVPASPPY